MAGRRLRCIVARGGAPQRGNRAHCRPPRARRSDQLDGAFSSGTLQTGVHSPPSCLICNATIVSFLRSCRTRFGIGSSSVPLPNLARPFPVRTGFASQRRRNSRLASPAWAASKMSRQFRTKVTGKAGTPIFWAYVPITMNLPDRSARTSSQNRPALTVSGSVLLMRIQHSSSSFLPELRFCVAQRTAVLDELGCRWDQWWGRKSRP